MGPIDIIVIAVIALIVGSAAAYIIKAKKNGIKCIGCSDSATCTGNCSACHGCSTAKKSEQQEKR
ncbi:MAG: FeoB-associated Cys-rich membrane protein [Ruminococcaceae bacterium]|nr:FeoB-associated Cys-rich membrane protein [Oscillospiraceae bacterium]